MAGGGKVLAPSWPVELPNLTAVLPAARQVWRSPKVMQWNWDHCHDPCPNRNADCHRHHSAPSWWASHLKREHHPHLHTKCCAFVCAMVSPPSVWQWLHHSSQDGHIREKWQTAHHHAPSTNLNVLPIQSCREDQTTFHACWNKEDHQDDTAHALECFASRVKFEHDDCCQHTRSKACLATCLMLICWAKSLVPSKTSWWTPKASCPSSEMWFPQAFFRLPIDLEKTRMRDPVHHKILPPASS